MISVSIASIPGYGAIARRFGKGATLRMLNNISIGHGVTPTDLLIITMLIDGCRNTFAERNPGF
jgi:hypothetical protein